MRAIRSKLLVTRDAGLSGVADARRRRALGAVRAGWLNPIADQCLQAWARFELGLAPRSDQSRVTIHRHGSRTASQPPESFKFGAGQLIDKVLAVTGAEGMGKSAYLHSLVARALDAADVDPSVSIPLPVNLVAWRESDVLADWIIDEAFVEFRFPAEITAPWIQGASIAVALDGLDELSPESRGACWSAIEDFRRDHPEIPIWVVAASPSAAEISQLAPDAVVEVGPLTGVEVAEYTEADAARGGLMHETAQQSSTFAEMLRIPLNLDLAVLGIDDADDSLGAHRAGLDETSRRFLARMERIEPPPSMDRLAAIGRAMSALALPNLRPSRVSTSWLVTAGSRRVYRVAAFVVAAIVGMALGLLGDWLLRGAIVDGSPQGTPEWWLRAGYLVGIVLAVGEAVSIKLGSSDYMPFERGAILSWLADITIRKLVPRLLIASAAAVLLLVGYSVVGGFAVVLAVVAGAAVSIGPMAGPVPALRWSWPSFLRKIYLRIALAVAAGLGVSLAVGVTPGLLFAAAFAFAAGGIGGIVAGFKKHVPALRPPQSRWWALPLEADVVRSVFGVVATLVLVGLIYGVAMERYPSDEVVACEPIGCGLRASATIVIVGATISLWHYGQHGNAQRWLALRIAARQRGFQARDLTALQVPRLGTISLGDGVMFAHPAVARLLAVAIPPPRAERSSR